MRPSSDPSPSLASMWETATAAGPFPSDPFSNADFQILFASAAFFWAGDAVDSGPLAFPLGQSGRRWPDSPQPKHDGLLDIGACVESCGAARASHELLQLPHSEGARADEGKKEGEAFAWHAIAGGVERLGGPSGVAMSRGEEGRQRCWHWLPCAAAEPLVRACLVRRIRPRCRRRRRRRPWRRRPWRRRLRLQ